MFLNKVSCVRSILRLATIVVAHVLTAFESVNREQRRRFKRSVGQLLAAWQRPAGRSADQLGDPHWECTTKSPQGLVGIGSVFNTHQT